MSLEQETDKFQIYDDDDKVTLSLTDNHKSEVTILKYGATVTSWVHNAKEQLWLSEGAKLDGSKPVRGGIPLVFPIFGKLKNPDHATFKLPQHGFARNSTWEFLGQTSASPLTVQFGLGPENVDPELYELWGEGKFDFTLLLSVLLSTEGLTTRIDVQNSGKSSFDFNWLFHTYLRVDDIEDTLVNNLVDQQCYDQLLAEVYTEKAPAVSFHEEFDRIYKNIDSHRTIQVIDKGVVLHNVLRENLPDAVVWNPWVKKAAGMADFLPKNGFHKMVCVEPGKVSSFVSLDPGAKWTAAQTLTVGGEILVQGDIY